MRFRNDKEPDDDKNVKIIAISFINCGKETGISMYNMNNNYKDIIT